jgi:hypothetical protein
VESPCLYCGEIECSVLVFTVAIVS